MRIRKRWPPPDLESTTILQPLSYDSQSSPRHHQHLLPSNQSLTVQNHRQPDPLVGVAFNNLATDVLEWENLGNCSENAFGQEQLICCVEEKNGDSGKRLYETDSEFPPPAVSRLITITEHPAGIGKEGVAGGTNGMTETNLRLRSDTGVESSSGSSAISPSSSPRERWCKEDKDFPLKKRRLSFVSKAKDTRKKEEEERKITILKKWSGHVYWEEGPDIEKIVSSSSSTGGGEKMESSRCSRVNGRGWRCSRPTLSGHSLCDHHLTNSRLRHMNSTRCKAAKINRRKANTTKNKENEDEDDEEDREETGKKRKRTGGLKARSMSSLLCQTVPL